MGVSKHDELIFPRGDRLYYRVKDQDGKLRIRASPYNVGEERDARIFARHLRDGFAERFRKQSAPPTIEDERLRLDRIRELDRAMIAEGIEISGYIYMILPNPQHIPKRIKIGFSDSPAIDRLRHIRTCCPEAELAASWKGSRAIEKYLLNTTSGRVGQYEVFDDQDIEATVTRFDKLLGQQVDAGGVPIERR